MTVYRRFLCAAGTCEGPCASKPSPPSLSAPEEEGLPPSLALAKGLPEGCDGSLMSVSS